ncbi:MAG: histidine phosphatase family protein [Candidatus Pelagadaptatus aseana]|uniref:histidine phosphatase family protein n=1 Tax=Candidatus Pelagadaptatus aseana TaxID=3120508 RepID=UPI0039B13FDA
MAEIYMVRHGQASFGADNYDQLSQLGHQQAQWLGEYFNSLGLQFDHIYQGDLVRHTETTAGIAKGLTTEFSRVNVMPELNEFDFKALVNVYLQQHPELSLPSKPSVKEFFHLLKQAMIDWCHGTLVSDQLPETWKGFHDRVAQAYNHIQQHCSGKVLVVSSGGTNAQFISQVLRTPAETVVDLNLQSRNTGVSHFYFNQHAVRLTSFNTTPHLDSAERQQYITHG